LPNPIEPGFGIEAPASMDTFTLRNPGFFHGAPRFAILPGRKPKGQRQEGHRPTDQDLARRGHPEER